MSKKLIATVFAVGFLFLHPAFTSNAQAKRLLPHLNPVKTGGTTKTVTKSRGVAAGVKFRADRRAIIVSYSNLSIASSVTYSLSYTANGISQGVTGTIIPSGEASTVTRELLFGSCSNGICRYDSNITNAKLTVTSVLKNGVKVVKTFKLKV